MSAVAELAIQAARARLRRGGITGPSRIDALRTLWRHDPAFRAEVSDAIDRLADPADPDFAAHYAFVHHRILPGDTLTRTRLDAAMARRRAQRAGGIA